MTPKTSLDERFSDPGAEAVAWPATQQVIENAELFWVTTVRADGRPHSTPLVAVWLDDALHFCTGETEQKAHNLAANPHMTASARYAIRAVLGDESGRVRRSSLP